MAICPFKLIRDLYEFLVVSKIICRLVNPNKSASIMDKLPFHLLKEITDSLDRRQRTRCARINRAFGVVCNLPFQYSCIPFIFPEGFAVGVERFADELLSPMIVFSGGTNLHHIRESDTDVIHRFCVRHPEIGRIVLHNVSLSSALMDPLAVAGSFDTIHTFVFVQSILRAKVILAPTHQFMWHLPMYYASITSDMTADFSVRMEALTNYLMDLAFFDSGEPTYVWLQQALAMVQESFVGERTVILQYLTKAHPHLGNEAIQLDQINLQEVHPRHLACIAKYIQTFAPYIIVQNTVPIAGLLYRI